MKILLAALLCIPLLALAEWGQFEFEEDKPWVELAAQLPPYPKEENLLPFDVPAANRNRHFIDAESISIGSDKVVRYTVVIESSGGARNVMFEGLRCATAERKLYAFGHADGSWSEARRPGWESVKLRSALSYRKPLFEELLCNDGIAVRDRAEAIRNLKRAAR